MIAVCYESPNRVGSKVFKGSMGCGFSKKLENLVDLNEFLGAFRKILTIKRVFSARAHPQI